MNYLTKKTDNFTLVSTYASFINYLKLDHFGYFNMGFSVAHMACYLSLHLKHKNIIFIGQDLAYAKMAILILMIIKIQPPMKVRRMNLF
ncbi:DUF115 domain-containing protein [Campylobacter jejuni]|nr:DUF115 domain-containing protein [Campylobacter jejuni]